MQHLDRIAFDPQVCHGRACIRGTRVQVSVVLDNLAAGKAEAEIVANYPSLAAEDVRAAALVFLPWVIAGPVVGIAAWMLDGVFVGATRTADMRDMMALSAALYFLAAWPLMAGWGNHGLWMALHLSWVARAGTLALRYPALERAAA